MEAREIIAKPESTELSVREQLYQEIEKAPNEDILAIAKRVSSLSKVSLFSLFNDKKYPLYGGINSKNPKIHW